MSTALSAMVRASSCYAELTDLTVIATVVSHSLIPPKLCTVSERPWFVIRDGAELVVALIVSAMHACFLRMWRWRQPAVAPIQSALAADDCVRFAGPAGPTRPSEPTGGTARVGKSRVTRVTARRFH